MRIGKQHKARRGEKGAAIYIALFILIPIAAITVGLLRVGISSSREHVRSGEDDRTLLLAEAGLAESLYALRTGGTGNVATAAAPAYFGNGVVWAEVERVGNDLLQLHSSAMLEGGRVALSLLVFEFSSSLFDSAVFSNTPLTISSQSLIDSFDSTLGPYDTQLTGSFVNDGAVVRSNGGITVDSSVEIYGDVHPGDDDSVGVANSSSVSGSQQPLPEGYVLGCVSTPGIASSGPLQVTTPTTLGPGSYNFSEIEIQGGADLSIEGPATLVIGDWLVESNAQMTFMNLSGPIQVYVTGDIDLRSNSMIATDSRTAVDLQIFLTGGPGQTADLRSNSEFYGAIYGCEADVRVRSNFEIFGAVLADTVVMDANAQIHYDEALKGLAASTAYRPVAWTRADFEDKVLLLNRRDPFQLIGISRDLLPVPGDAHL